MTWLVYSVLPNIMNVLLFQREEEKWMKIVFMTKGHAVWKISLPQKVSRLSWEVGNKMDQQQKTILLIASRLLSYPEGVLDEQSLDEFIDMHMKSEEIKGELKVAYAPLVRLPLLLHKELYVETFDLRSKTGLYLTAHELGDSPKRGA